MATGVSTSLSGCTAPRTDGGSPSPVDDQPEPAVGEPELDFVVEDGECGGMNGDRATAGVSGSQVTIVGAVPTANPCYTLNAHYHSSTETPELHIDSEALGTMCVQCLGVVKYTAVLEFEDGSLPDEIIVTHAHGSESTEIPVTIKT